LKSGLENNNNGNQNQVLGNGIKQGDQQNTEFMGLNPFGNNSQIHNNIFTPQTEVNPFAMTSQQTNPHVAPSSIIDPFSIQNESFSDNPFTNNEPNNESTDTQKQDPQQQRSLFSPENVRDPFGLENEKIEETQKKKPSESIFGKIGKYFLKEKKENHN